MLWCLSNFCHHALVDGQASIYSVWIRIRTSTDTTKEFLKILLRNFPCSDASIPTTPLVDEDCPPGSTRSRISIKCLWAWKKKYVPEKYRESEWHALNIQFSYITVLQLHDLLFINDRNKLFHSRTFRPIRLMFKNFDDLSGQHLIW